MASCCSFGFGLTGNCRTTDGIGVPYDLLPISTGETATAMRCGCTDVAAGRLAGMLWYDLTSIDRSVGITFGDCSKLGITESVESTDVGAAATGCVGVAGCCKAVSCFGISTNGACGLNSSIAA